MMRVSVIIPIYRDVAGLSGTLLSLGRQTLPRDQYEVIVVNDGGDPEVTAFCGEKGLKVMEIIPNRGSYNARNEGIRQAVSENLAFIDAGIIAEEHWLERGLDYLRRYDYVAGEVKIIKGQVRDIATFHDYLTAFPMREYFRKYGFGGAGNLFVKRTLIDRAGAFNASLRSGGDLEFGDRVSRLDGITRCFAEDCVVYHPPRGHEEKVEKLKRVAKGHAALLRLDNERFSFLQKKDGLGRWLTSRLPPSRAAVERIYQYDPRFSKWQLYRYMYKLKLVKASLNQ